MISVEAIGELFNDSLIIVYTSIVSERYFSEGRNWLIHANSLNRVVLRMFPNLEILGELSMHKLKLLGVIFIVRHHALLL